MYGNQPYLQENIIEIPSAASADSGLFADEEAEPILHGDVSSYPAAGGGNRDYRDIRRPKQKYGNGAEASPTENEGHKDIGEAGNGRRISKVLVFYDDNTYQELK